jgi:2-polyprenyl-3-methyl-5-hydroxy-6-metoxy-1,4-benzoquinol methylase
VDLAVTEMTAERTIWDFWAARYEGLWAQHFSLRPSRELVHARLVEVGLPADGRALDLGCGVGQFASELADRQPGLELVGVDPSAGMIERASADYARDNVSYAVGTWSDVQRGSGFDLITCMHAFPYVPNKVAAMAHFGELLRPGGRLLIVQANTETWFDAGFLLFVKLTTTAAAYHGSADLHALMADAGLAAGVVRGIDKPFFIPSIQVVEGVLEGGSSP